MCTPKPPKIEDPPPPPVENVREELPDLKIGRNRKTEKTRRGGDLASLRLGTPNPGGSTSTGVNLGG